MADAQVAVRFAVKDAEVVRQALQNLGKDGEEALKRFDAAGKPVPKGLTAISDTVGELKGRASQLAGSTGLVGTALLGLGPIGLATAAALGAVYLAFDKISSGAKAAGQYSRDVRDFGNATNFTTTEVQALSDVFQQNGISAEKSRSGLEKFAVAREEARHGSGALYDALRKTNAAMAEEFAAARTAPEALGVFTKALRQADDTTRAFLARQAFGRGGVAFAQGLLDMAGRGGLGAIEAAAIKTGAALDDALIQKQAQAAIEAERKATIVERNWNQAYANVYSVWKDFKKNVLGLDPNNELTISIKIREATASFGKDSLTTKTEAELKARLEQARADAERPVVTDAGPRNPALLQALKGAQAPWKRQQDAELAGAIEDELDRRREGAREGLRAKGLGDAERPRSLMDDKADLERANAKERERLGILGDTATAQELLKAKENELLLVRMNNADVTKAETDRVREGYAIQLAARDVALHSQLGVVTATELHTQKQRELNQQLALGKISEEQYADALRLSRKEIDDTIKAQEVRRSDFPNLVRLRQEGENLKGLFDQELSSALRGTTADLLAIAKGTDTVSAGLLKMGQRFADAFAQAMLMKTLIGPLAGAASGGLSSLFGLGGSAKISDPTFGGFSLAGTNAFSVKAASGRLFDRGLVPFAQGGIFGSPTLFRFAAGGGFNTGLLGEAGPEAIMPLRRLPSGRLGVEGGAAMHVSVGSTTINIQGSADNQTLRVMHQELARRDRELPGKIVSTVRGARSDRVL